jgi:hypothetical protein
MILTKCQVMDDVGGIENAIMRVVAGHDGSRDLYICRDGRSEGFVALATTSTLTSVSAIWPMFQKQCKLKR